MNIRQVPATDKKAIIAGLEKIIKSHTLAKTRIVISHYFKNYSERAKAQKRIDELRKEIAQLEKKK
jgi:hypothetical protein